MDEIEKSQTVFCLDVWAGIHVVHKVGRDEMYDFESSAHSTGKSGSIIQQKGFQSVARKDVDELHMLHLGGSLYHHSLCKNEAARRDGHEDVKGIGGLFPYAEGAEIPQQAISDCWIQNYFQNRFQGSLFF